VHVVVQDKYTLPVPAATVMAHEIGHNFGFRHDDELERETGYLCGCYNPGGKCIMNSLIRY